MKIAQIGFVTLAMTIWTVNAFAQGVNAYFAANGFDSNPCTQAAPCLTLSQASAMSYPPGSTINFRGGDSFTGCWALTPTNVPGGGDKNNPIVVQSYGAGRATMVSSCSGNYNPQLDIAGISGVVVQNLKFQGDGATTEVGILIEGPGDTITIQNNEVTGFVFVSNVAGEILVLGLGAHGSTFGCNSSLNNIQVLDNSLHGASVTSRDANGIYGFGCGQNITNVHYAGNHVWNIGGGGSSAGPFSPNGIVVNGVASGIVEHNLVHDIGANQTTCGGPIGIIAYSAGSGTSPGSILIQFNEVYNVQPVPDQGGCDFAAYDIDGGGTINVTVQYNYSHDNAGAAWMICCGAGNGNVIRYNISENDDKYYKSGGVVVASAVVFQIYNNTIWIPPVGTDPNHAQACYFFGFSGTFPVGALIANNICYAGSPDQSGTAWYADSGAQVPPDITNVQFFQNLYNVGGLWRINGGVYHSLPEVLAIGKEAGSIVSDPNATAPGGGGTCAWDPTQHNGPQPCPAAYRLLTGSLGLDAGVDLRAAPFNLDVGTQDYYGNPITTTPNIGADQDQ
jgi:hypothetical protein